MATTTTMAIREPAAAASSNSSASSASSSRSRGSKGSTRSDGKKNVVVARRRRRSSGCTAVIQSRWLVDYSSKQANLSSSSLLRLQKLVEPAGNKRSRSSGPLKHQEKLLGGDDEDQDENDEDRRPSRGSLSSLSSHKKKPFPSLTPLARVKRSSSTTSTGSCGTCGVPDSNDPLLNESEHSLNLDKVFEHRQTTTNTSPNQSAANANNNNSKPKLCCISVTLSGDHEKIKFSLRNPEVVKAVRKALAQQQHEQDQPPKQQEDGADATASTLSPKASPRKSPALTRREIKCVIPHDRFQLPQMSIIKQPEQQQQQQRKSNTATTTTGTTANKLHSIDEASESATDAGESTSNAGESSNQDNNLMILTSSKASMLSSCDSFAMDSFDSSINVSGKSHCTRTSCGSRRSSSPLQTTEEDVEAEKDEEETKEEDDKEEEGDEEESQQQTETGTDAGTASFADESVRYSLGGDDESDVADTLAAVLAAPTSLGLSHKNDEEETDTEAEVVYYGSDEEVIRDDPPLEAVVTPPGEGADEPQADEVDEPPPLEDSEPQPKKVNQSQPEDIPPPLTETEVHHPTEVEFHVTLPPVLAEAGDETDSEGGDEESVTEAGDDHDDEESATDAAEEDDDGSATDYNESVTEVGYNESMTEVGYHASATSMAYNESATSVAFNESVTVIAYHGSRTAMGYNESVTEVAYNESATEVGYNESATEVGYNESATEMGYDSSAAQIVYDESETEVAYDTEAALDGDDTETERAKDDSNNDHADEDTIGEALDASNAQLHDDDESEEEYEEDLEPLEAEGPAATGDGSIVLRKEEEIRDEANEAALESSCNAHESDAESQREAVEEVETDGEESLMTAGTDESSQNNAMSYGLSVYLSNHSRKGNTSAAGLSKKSGNCNDSQTATSTTESITDVSGSMDESAQSSVQTSSTHRSGSSSKSSFSLRSHLTIRTSSSDPCALLSRQDSMRSIRSELDESGHSRSSRCSYVMTELSRASSAPTEGEKQRRRPSKLLSGDSAFTDASGSSLFIGESEGDDSTVGSAVDHRRRRRPRRFGVDVGDDNPPLQVRSSRSGRIRGVKPSNSAIIPRSNTPQGVLLRTRSGDGMAAMGSSRASQKFHRSQTNDSIGSSRASHRSDSRPLLPPRNISRDKTMDGSSIIGSGRRVPSRSRSMMGGSSNANGPERGRMSRTKSGHRESFLGGSRIKKWDGSSANKSGHGLSLLERHLTQGAQKASAKNNRSRRRSSMTASRTNNESIASLSMPSLARGVS